MCTGCLFYKVLDEFHICSTKSSILSILSYRILCNFVHCVCRGLEQSEERPDDVVVSFATFVVVPVLTLMLFRSLRKRTREGRRDQEQEGKEEKGTDPTLLNTHAKKERKNKERVASCVLLLLRDVGKGFQVVLSVGAASTASAVVERESRETVPHTYFPHVASARGATHTHTYPSFFCPKLLLLLPPLVIVCLFVCVPGTAS